MLSGLLGVGGGVIFVPLLTYLTKIDFKTNTGISSLAVVFVASASSLTYIFNDINKLKKLCSNVDKHLNLQSKNDEKWESNFITESKQINIKHTSNELEKIYFIKEDILLISEIKALKKVTNEIKTKPTQHSVNALRAMGIQPDFLVCRSDEEFDNGIKSKHYSWSVS